MNQRKNKEVICPKCKRVQYPILDRNYLELYGICWLEDKDNWLQGKITTEEFEKRERLALEHKLKF